MRIPAGEVLAIILLTVGICANLLGCQGEQETKTEQISEQTPQIPLTPVPANEQKHVNLPPVKNNLVAESPDKTKLKPARKENKKGEIPEGLIEKAKAQGIVLFNSPRIKLWSDLPEENVKSLLVASEKLLDELNTYFEKTPLKLLNEDRDFIGYLINDNQKFRELGMMPVGIVRSEHGTYQDNKFWVKNQLTDYYRQHLLFHEIIHAYMMVKPNDWPPAYQEGMAELLATHRNNDQQKLLFRVFPHNVMDFNGLTRLQTILQETQKQQHHSLQEILQLKNEEFPNQLPAYSWSWGWAYFLANHPLTREHFLELVDTRSAEMFHQKFLAICGDHLDHLELEWKIFTHQIQAGNNYPEMFIQLPPVTADAKNSFAVKADAGWQNSGWFVKQGDQLEINAAGQVILDTVPKDWITEANGISLRYAQNQPLGILQLALYTTENESGSTLDDTDFLTPVQVGTKINYQARKTGWIYFRVNDFWTEIWNNQGSYQITIKK